MSDRIALNEPEYGPIIAQISGADYFPSVCVNFARLVDEQFIGGVLYSNFTGESICIHAGAVTPFWLNRDMLFIAFDYPFNQLGVKRIFGQVPEDNVHALRFNERLGIRPIVRIPGVYPDNVACIVGCMEAEECRFLDIKPRTLRAPTLH